MSDRLYVGGSNSDALLVYRAASALVRAHGLYKSMRDGDGRAPQLAGLLDATANAEVSP